MATVADVDWKRPYRNDESRAVLALRALTVAVSYFLTARLCLNLAPDDAVLTPLWVPSGIALAAVLGWGRGMLVAVGVADYLGSLATGITPGTALVLAGADVAEPAIAAAIIQRLGITVAFSRTRCVLALLIAAPIGAAVSASVGVYALDAAGSVVAAPWRAWLRYWMSAVAAMLLITPLLLSWLRQPWLSRPIRARIWEGAACATLLAAISWFVFVAGNWDMIELLLVSPVLSWAVVRFGTRGATATGTLFAAIAIYGVVHDSVVVEGLDPTRTAELLQVLITVASAANLVIAASLLERDTANTRLREVLDTFNQSQHFAGTGSWELPFDDSGRVWVSDQLADMLGIGRSSDGTVEVEALLELTPSNDRDAFRHALARTRRTRQPFEIEHRVVLEGNERILAHSAGLVRGGGDERDDRIVGSVVDVTEDREIEHFKDDLIATASHELRTPLASIVGFADTLVDRWDEVPDNGRREFVGIIDEQAHRLERIVEDTLVQSRVDSGTLHPHITTFLVGRSVRAAIELAAVVPVVEFDVEPGLIARGDPAQFERVLVNLISNADKYGAPPITVRGRTRDPWAEIRVEDHGRGVPYTFQQRMFERFTRAPDIGTAPGTGLGLSISRGLVQAAGGTIRYERWAGISSFVVRLPLG